jgi:hypothetical protein
MSAPFVGVDLEQFVIDPHATGIQRVLQYLAREWPTSVAGAFVFSRHDELVMIDPAAAVALINRVFDERSDEDDLAARIDAVVDDAPCERLTRSVEDTFSHWLLPEVSYAPSVLQRARSMREHATLTMIGYDALPMTEPANYRFVPGRASLTSEYFRLLAQAQHVVAISDYARTSIDAALRRRFVTDVAHPGGDHVEPRSGRPPKRTRFLRVGTLEARKHPTQILTAFEEAVDRGLDADLVFIGRPSASNEAINERLRSSIRAGYPVQWIAGAPDRDVHEAMNSATYFLSLGIEGYGIPVLESIRLGTPVLFDGIQPAAELMEGRGAQRIGAGATSDLADALTQAALALPPTLKPESVPTWGDFVSDVIEAATRPPLAS